MTHKQVSQIVSILYPETYTDPARLETIEDIMQMQYELGKVVYTSSQLWKMGQSRLLEMADVLQQTIYQSEAYLL